MQIHSSKPERPRRRRRRPADQLELIHTRRAQLSRAAIELFGAKGYHATTVRDVAARSGCSAGLVYQYFRDKEDLLFYAIMEILDSYLREIPKAIAGVESAATRFEAAVRAYARVLDSHRHAAALGYRESWSLRKDRLALVFRKEQETHALIRRCVDDCITAGVFRSIDAEILTYQIIVVVHAWAHSAWRLTGIEGVEDYLDRNLQVLLSPVRRE